MAPPVTMPSLRTAHATDGVSLAWTGVGSGPALIHLPKGDTNAGIAGELGLSIHTVERHVANIYRKIDARGRADATAFAVRRGLA
jgi:hypothetical protein